MSRRTTKPLWNAVEYPPHLVTVHPSLRTSPHQSTSALPFWLTGLVENAPAPQSRRASPSPNRSVIPTQQRQQSSSSLSSRTSQSPARVSSTSPSRSALACQMQQVLKSKQADLRRAEANLDRLGNAASESEWERYDIFCVWRDQRRAKVRRLEAGLTKAWSKDKAELAKKERDRFESDDWRIRETHDKLARMSPQWAEELVKVRTMKREVQALESELEKQRNQLLKPSLM